MVIFSSGKENKLIRNAWIKMWPFYRSICSVSVPKTTMRGNVIERDLMWAMHVHCAALKSFKTPLVAKQSQAPTLCKMSSLCGQLSCLQEISGEGWRSWSKPTGRQAAAMPSALCQSPSQAAKVQTDRDRGIGRHEAPASIVLGCPPNGTLFPYIVLCFWPKYCTI